MTCFRVVRGAVPTDRLAELDPAQRSPLVNVGSSTGEFREVRQPHIDRIVFAPLRAAGVEVVHADVKAAPGVDLVGDLTEDRVLEVQQRGGADGDEELRAVGARTGVGHREQVGLVEG